MADFLHQPFHDFQITSEFLHRSRFPDFVGCNAGFADMGTGPLDMSARVGVKVLAMQVFT